MLTLTFNPVTLTFDLELELLQCIVCDVMKLCSRLERKQAIHGAVIVLSVFDLVTLNIVLCVAFGSGIIFTKFHL